MISAPASKKVMLRGRLLGSLLAMLWGVASGATYIAEPRKVESVAPAVPKDLTSTSVSLSSKYNSSRLEGPNNSYAIELAIVRFLH